MLDLTSPELSRKMAEIEGRLHVLGGLIDALERIDQVNRAIQLAGDRETALFLLQEEPFSYSAKQAQAVLDMPMGWQTASEAERLRDERDRLLARRAGLREHVAEILALHWFG